MVSSSAGDVEVLRILVLEAFLQVRREVERFPSEVPVDLGSLPSSWVFANAVMGASLRAWRVLTGRSWQAHCLEPSCGFFRRPVVEGVHPSAHVVLGSLL